MDRSWTALSPKERQVLQGVDLALIEALVVPLFLAFVILNLADALTTLFAFKSGLGFVEFNPFAAYLFSKEFAGFMAAYLFKLVPVAPLLYMAFTKGTETHEPEVRLLRLAALAVLAIADVYFGIIVFGNNLPRLVMAGVI